MAAEPLSFMLLLCLCCLVIADGVLTHEILRRGGKELNPVLRWLFEKLGVIEGIVLSRLILLAVFIAVFKSSPMWLFALFNAFYGFVVVHNINQLAKDK